jgi:hypothetical protein
MKSPIVVIEKINDITVFRSPEQAAGYLELVDVKDGIYTAYDAEGFQLDLGTGFAMWQRQFLWIRWQQRYEAIIFSEPDPRLNRSKELRERLIAFLGFPGKKAETLQAATLEELIRLVGKQMPWKL